MAGNTTAGTARGVTSLMYVGDVTSDLSGLSSGMRTAGLVGLALALFGGGITTRAAGAGVAGYVYARGRGLV